MKFTNAFLGAVSATAALVSAVAVPEPESLTVVERSAGQLPAGVTEYPYQLSIAQAKDLVTKYQSAQQNVSYNGLSPLELTNKILRPDYHEYSDSVTALMSKDLPLQGAAVINTREEWYNLVMSRPPIKVINTNSLYVAGRNQIIWFWTRYPGTAKLPVNGYSLLRIDSNLQIYETDIEFNNIAWGIDTYQLQQYCAPLTSSASSAASTATSTSTSTSSATATPTA